MGLPESEKQQLPANINRNTQRRNAIFRPNDLLRNVFDTLSNRNINIPEPPVLRRQNAIDMRVNDVPQQTIDWYNNQTRSPPPNRSIP